MTNMKHKSVDARKRRHARYKEAINPIRVLFGCTAMEAVDHIRAVLSKNKNLEEEVEKLEKELKEAKNAIEMLEAGIKPG